MYRSYLRILCILYLLMFGGLQESQPDKRRGDSAQRTYLYAQTPPYETGKALPYRVRIVLIGKLVSNATGKSGKSLDAALPTNICNRHIWRR